MSEGTAETLIIIITISKLEHTVIQYNIIQGSKFWSQNGLTVGNLLAAEFHNINRKGKQFQELQYSKCLFNWYYKNTAKLSVQ